jgi:hypothetical protein
MLSAIPRHQTIELGTVRAHPHPRQLGHHRANGSNRWTGITPRHTGCLHIGFEIAPVAGRQPPHQPTQRSTQPLHQRQRQASEEVKNTGVEGHELFTNFDKSTRIFIVAELKNYLQGDNIPRYDG